MGVEGSQSFVHLGYPMWDYFHSLALYLSSPSRLSHMYGVFLVSTGRVRIDMVFGERGETSKAEPCVQDNAWPTDCKFIFLTMKFLQVDPTSICTFHDNFLIKRHLKILLARCWCFLVNSLWCTSILKKSKPFSELLAYGCNHNWGVGTKACIMLCVLCGKLICTVE
jgi:hypothetical protein